MNAQCRSGLQGGCAGYGDLPITDFSSDSGGDDEDEPARIMMRISSSSSSSV